MKDHWKRQPDVAHNVERTTENAPVKVALNEPCLYGRLIQLHRNMNSSMEIWTAERNKKRKACINESDFGLKQQWLLAFQNKSQTRQRFRIMLFIRTKHNIQILGGNPLYQATKWHKQQLNGLWLSHVGFVNEKLHHENHIAQPKTDKWLN